MKNLRRFLYYPDPLPHFGVNSKNFKDVGNSIKMVIKKKTSINRGHYLVY